MLEQISPQQWCLLCLEIPLLLLLSLAFPAIPVRLSSCLETMSLSLVDSVTIVQYLSTFEILVVPVEETQQ